jgi:hypothetical protein
MSILSVPATLWSIGRKFETLFADQRKAAEALNSLDGRLRTLEDRVTRMEAAQSQLITEARAAAVAATTAVAGGVISEIVTRVTRIEMRLGESGGRLPLPGPGQSG